MKKYPCNGPCNSCLSCQEQEIVHKCSGCGADIFQGEYFYILYNKSIYCGQCVEQCTED
jgi:dissimilatory sulfite reductase (desulfoviridin) alpha/beta subunit